MLSTKSIISEAPRLWHHLNGVINVYKPSGLSMNQVQASIIKNMCRDMNNLKVRPPKQIVKIEEMHDELNNETKYVVKQEENLADHVRVVGQRYQPVDFKSLCSCHLGKFSSGVLVIGINNGTKTAFRLRDNKPIRVYHVTGKFGRATESHLSDSPVTMRATFDHVYLPKLNSLLASLQASHQKKMFEVCGVDIQSQAAFDLAAQGPIRPADSSIPIIYSMKCIDYRKYQFTIEVNATNESEAYLGILIHEIGLELRTVAYCSQIRCIRQSYFTLEDTLVRRHWNVETILQNMLHCQELLQKHPKMLTQPDPILRESK